jgi:hypothetical protein
MAKKTPKPIDVLRSYLYRNNKEQELPKGFISKNELMDMLHCSENQFARVIPHLVKCNEIEKLELKRLKNGRIHKMPYFKVSKTILDMIK